MPVASHAAVIHRKYMRAAYTSVINLLNYSSVVIPVTKADKWKDPLDNEYEPLDSIDKMKFDAWKYTLAVVIVSLVSALGCLGVTARGHGTQLTRNIDNPNVYHRALVGVQLVSRKFEEKMLAIAKVVCDALAVVQKRKEYYTRSDLDKSPLDTSSVSDISGNTLIPDDGHVDEPPTYSSNSHEPSSEHDDGHADESPTYSSLS